MTWSWKHRFWGWTILQHTIDQRNPLKRMLIGCLWIVDWAKKTSTKFTTVIRCVPYIVYIHQKVWKWVSSSIPVRYDYDKAIFAWEMYWISFLFIYCFLVVQNKELRFYIISHVIVDSGKKLSKLFWIPWMQCLTLLSHNIHQRKAGHLFESDNSVLWPNNEIVWFRKILTVHL